MVPVVPRIREQLAGHLAVRLVPSRWGELVQPLERVGLNSGLVVVDPHAGRDMHGRDQDHALGDPGRPDGLFDVLGDPHELAALLGPEGAVDGVGLHEQGSRDSNPDSRFWRPRA
jgi:hypothetical protein